MDISFATQKQESKSLTELGLPFKRIKIWLKESMKAREVEEKKTVAKYAERKNFVRGWRFRRFEIT
jgi:hypothetical protein